MDGKITTGLFVERVSGYFFIHYFFVVCILRSFLLIFLFSHQCCLHVMERSKNDWIRIHDIIQFSNFFYGTAYAENSRETFRKQLHRFCTAALAEIGANFKISAGKHNEFKKTRPYLGSGYLIFWVKTLLRQNMVL